VQRLDGQEADAPGVVVEGSCGRRRHGVGDAAKRKGGPRKALELLLAEIEHAEATRPLEQRFDVDELWMALGLK
jgi:hypothetical protein